MRKIESRHDAAGDEMLCDPVCRIAMIEAIGSVAVIEDVQEEPAFRLQPLADALKQRLPVRHVLEHFHRYDTIEMAVGREIIHISRYHRQIGEPALLRALDYILALRSRVRNRRNPCIGKTACHVKGERAPAATELKNIHAILQAGM